MILSGEAEVRAWLRSTVGCDALALERLERLAFLLTEENDRQTLVSARSLDAVWLRHFADSAQLLTVPRETCKGVWLDLGTGAGFPGLVIAICRPDLEVRMVESRRRRVEWLDSAVNELGLDRAETIPHVLERVPLFPAGTISARAFAPLGHLIALSARFSTHDTVWLLPKGQNGRNELREMPKSVQSMFHVKQSVTDPASVILVGKGSPR